MINQRLASALLASVALTGLGSAQLYLPPAPPQRPDAPRQLPPPIRLTQLRVVARVDDGVASTELHQVFRNDGPRLDEASWVLPLPRSASADRFTMKVDGQEIAGEVLDAQRARQIYEDIVRRRRDPGLLEYAGTGCLRARIFPIPARGEVEVLVRYRQVLPATGGLHEWTFPLRAAGAEGQAAESVSLELTVESKRPIKNAWSPLAGVDVQRQGDHRVRASFELCGGRLPPRDLTIFYGVAEGDFGVDLLTYRKAGQPGFFLMMLSPALDAAEAPASGRLLHFVIDTSGSMKGSKIEQARAALRFFVQSLRPQDVFNVVPFSTEARPFFPQPVPADREHIDRALALVGDIEARGGTNIEDGLRAALTPALPAGDGPALLPITVFLTDGLPTVGTTDIGTLLRQAKKDNRNDARIFVFGIGNDVNTHLLDKIAEDSRGDRDYVREDEDIEVKTSALFTKLSHPVMTGVELTCDGVDGFDLLPRTAPDLFKGSRLLVVGRYRGHGHHAIKLRGTVGGVRREYVYEGSFTATASEHDFLPTLWAERKIGALLDAIRLNGEQKELLDEVRALGREFGVVTPYTSHLILEDGARVSRAYGIDPARRNFSRYDEAQVRRLTEELRRGGAAGGEALQARLRQPLAEAAREEAKKAADKLGDLPSAPAIGATAVADSAGLLALSRRAAVGRAADDDSITGITCQRVKDRRFHLIDGVWVDASLQPSMHESMRKVAAFSDEYFALLAAHPELAPYLAFSVRIVVVVDGGAIEIV